VTVSGKQLLQARSKQRSERRVYCFTLQAFAADMSFDHYRNWQRVDESQQQRFVFVSC